MDWVAAIFELSGSWLTGNRKRICFVLTGLGNCVWILYVFTTKSTYGLLAVVIPALIINARNFRAWGHRG